MVEGATESLNDDGKALKGDGEALKIDGEAHYVHNLETSISEFRATTGPIWAGIQVEAADTTKVHDVVDMNRLCALSW